MCGLTVAGRFVVGPVASSFTPPDLCSVEGVACIASVHCTALEGGAPVSVNSPVSRITQASTVISCMCVSEGKSFRYYTVHAH